MTIVVGGGLAGLAAAAELARTGSPFLLLEASDRPGGRVRSLSQDGFILDRGFQVILTSYPFLRSPGLLDSLQPCFFEAGALIHEPGGLFRVANPLFRPEYGAAALLDPPFKAGDLWRLVRMAASLLTHRSADLLAGCASEEDETTEGYLRRLGFSEEALRGFFQPFFGGVMLDETLSSSSALFRYYFAMFAKSRVMIPRGGIQELPNRMAATLPAKSVRYHTKVRSLKITGNRVSRVVLDSGEELEAERVILALDDTSCGELLERPSERDSRPVWTAYFRNDQPLYAGGWLVLCPGKTRRVRHFCNVTNIDASLAPSGHHLVSATILNPRGLSAQALLDAAGDEIRAAFPSTSQNLQPLTLLEIPHAIPAQSPGFAKRLSKRSTPYSNVTLAGDQTGIASIQFAIESGTKAARIHNEATNH